MGDRGMAVAGCSGRGVEVEQESAECAIALEDFRNLRRSLLGEITLTLFFIASIFGARPLRASAVVVAILLFPAVAQAFFSLVQWPPWRFWRMFLREVTWRFARGIADAFVQLTFLLHQALLMTDAITRTLYRRLVVGRNCWSGRAWRRLNREAGR